MQSALAAGKTITGISKANPAVVTATAHGLAIGDVVKLSEINGMTELDGQEFVVGTVPTANTFSLSGVDSTGYATFSSDSPANATVQKVTFTDFCELTGFQQQDAAASEIDVTTICSTAKEFEVGLSDSGSLTLDYNYAGKETVQAALRAAKIAGTQIAFKLVLPNSGGTLIMFGSVQSQSISGTVSDVIKGNATIKLSGNIYVLD
ncbi:MAG: phage tail tube protein [Planctomycetota bacterium]